MVKENSINKNAQGDQGQKADINNESSNNVKEPSGIEINQRTEHYTRTRKENRNEEVLQIDST